MHVCIYYTPWNIQGSYSWVVLPFVSPSECPEFVSGQYIHYLKSDFKTISQKWSPYRDDVSRATFLALPWRSRSQHFIDKLHLWVQNLFGEHHPVCPALVLKTNRLQIGSTVNKWCFYVINYNTSSFFKLKNVYIFIVWTLFLE